MSTTYVVGVRIDGNAASYLRATQQAQAATRSFTGDMRAEFQRLRSFMASTQGQLGSLGLGVGLLQIQKNAALLEKQLTQSRLTAGSTYKEQVEAYRELFTLGRNYGGVIEDNEKSYKNLLAAGLKHKEALEATKAIALASAVTGADGNPLSSSLSVGAAYYGFDLSKMGVATTILDKMTVAGRLGKAEIENLSGIFPVVADNAQKAGMGFEKTLAYIEALSKYEARPDRLGTLADSTLRLFSNANYSKDAQAATGVRFFDNNGSRRDSIQVLEDMRKKFQALQSDAQRFNFISGAFGKSDLDTQRGVFRMLSGAGLEDIRKFEEQIKNAGGTLARDVPTAINNAATQAERLKNTLRLAGEEFARPLNEAFTNSVKYLLDGKEAGGRDFSGGQILGGAAVGAAGAYAAARFLPGVLGRVIGRTGGLAAGVAEGKALQSAAGVTPVYVTNWAEMSGGGGGVAEAAGGAVAAAAMAGKLSKLRNMAGAAALLGNVPHGVLMGMGAAGWGAMAGGAGLAGAAGYGVGTGIYKYGLEGNRGGDFIGESIAKVLALFGNSEAQRSLAVNEALKNTKVGGEITIRVSGAPGLGVQTDTKAMPGTRLSSLGQTNQGAGF